MTAAKQHEREHQRARRALVAHFEARSSPAAETELRAHLPACDRCRQQYRRHLLLAPLDPRAASPRERLAVGLGLRRRARGGRTMAWLAAPAMVALIVMLLVRGAGPSSFAVRGSGRAAPSMWIYRIGADDRPRPVGERIAPDDELAFAYANPRARHHLLIFGVDEHRHVYWYHPAWLAGARPPTAIAARSGPGPYELPEAVRHEIDGARLDIYAVFTDATVGVETIDRAATAGAAVDGLIPGGPADVVHRVLEVRR